MARTKGFNPKAVLVARKSRGLSLGGKRYEQGDAIDDDCITFRKRRQLYAQNLVCHPHELDKKSAPAEVEEDKNLADGLTAEEEAEKAKSTEDAVNPEAGNGDDADASVAEVSDTQESEGEASSEPEKKEAAKPARRRSKRKQPSKE